MVLIVMAVLETASTGCAFALSYRILTCTIFQTTCPMKGAVDIFAYRRRFWGLQNGLESRKPDRAASLRPSMLRRRFIECSTLYAMGLCTQATVHTTGMTTVVWATFFTNTITRRRLLSDPDTALEPQRSESQLLFEWINTNQGPAFGFLSKPYLTPRTRARHGLQHCCLDVCHSLEYPVLQRKPQSVRVLPVRKVQT